MHVRSWTCPTDGALLPERSSCVTCTECHGAVLPHRASPLAPGAYSTDGSVLTSADSWRASTVTQVGDPCARSDRRAGPGSLSVASARSARIAFPSASREPAAPSGNVRCAHVRGLSVQHLPNHLILHGHSRRGAESKQRVLIATDAPTHACTAASPMATDAPARESMLCPGDIAGLGGNDGSDVDVCAHSGFLRFTAADSNSPSAVWPSYNGWAHCTPPGGSIGTHTVTRR
jgi:hypothetical protein